ncbi:MAG: tyrosine--tRNA ligase [bacterium]
MTRLSPEKEAELIADGSAEIISIEELSQKIERARKENRQLIVKYGADPSAPDIHLGHVVCLDKLRQIQHFGHLVVFLIGDFTGMIGDPSGRSKTRMPLTRKEIEANARTYRDQVSKVLDVSKAVIEYNSKWSISLTPEDIIRLCSKHTLARVLERDDFAIRFKNEIPISIHELLYPIFQAYDSVMLKADIEMGGTDQKFNFLLARDLQREFCQEPQVVLMMPLLLGTDGKEKMSKSLGNQIGITDEPREMFGKVMSIPDNILENYYRLLSHLSNDEIDKIFEDIKNGKINPRDVKLKLAHLITSSFYSVDIANECQEEFKRVFSEGGLPDEIDEYEVSTVDGRVWLIGIIEEMGLCSSKSEARRLLRQGAVYLNNRRLSQKEEDIIINSGDILKVGKRRFVKLRIKSR